MVIHFIQIQILDAQVQGVQVQEVRVQEVRVQEVQVQELEFQRPLDALQPMQQNIFDCKVATSLEGTASASAGSLPHFLALQVIMVEVDAMLVKVLDLRACLTPPFACGLWSSTSSRFKSRMPRSRESRSRKSRSRKSRSRKSRSRKSRSKKSGSRKSGSRKSGSRKSRSRNHRCTYGTGNPSLHPLDNMKHQACMCDAMIIDTYFSGNESVLQERAKNTSALLFSLFDVAHLQYYESIDKDTHDESFENYARQLKNAVKLGYESIISNVKKELVNRHRVLQGWCWVLSQAFLFNFSYFCKEFHMSLSKTTTLSFSVNDLLAKVGLDDNHSPQLLTQCLDYDLSSEEVNDFECVLVDITTVIPVTTAQEDRPIQEEVRKNFFNKRGILAKLGDGWDYDSCVLYVIVRQETQQGR